jgi:hypothetical protein
VLTFAHASDPRSGVGRRSNPRRRQARFTTAHRLAEAHAQGGDSRQGCAEVAMFPRSINIATTNIAVSTRRAIRPRLRMT